ncbi:hypothetical protein LSCM1_04630 [Leishmania martiniquensis]|uniref:Uncharacterized protein n=1 Tax=Leishmania martiniquensis TaxID=1580590 RepID=A0A836H873_9TRYP|nr:hypothetical protein LSCM1_04630 [Leishmania martiniquensis]
MAEISQVQVVCAHYTAIVEEYVLFRKVRQLVAQALPFGKIIVGSHVSSARKSAVDAKGVPHRPSPAARGAHQHIKEEHEEDHQDASTRLAALALPASLLRAWLWRAEAAADGSITDADSVATQLQSSGEVWLSVQTALEYASLTYGPIHVISWLQWEEVSALYKAEQPRHKWYAESAAATAGALPLRRTPPRILVQVVLLWLYEGKMYRLTPAELLKVDLQAREVLTAQLPPPHAALTVPSAMPCSRSLFTCYLALECPPGTLWPHHIPVPMAEPLLTRQELIELVRATANIRRHHPLRVAYRVWPQATLPTAAAPATAAPGSGSRAGISSAATRVVMAAPTTRAPPLRALESDAAMAELIRDVLAYGCTSVQIVAVRSGRVRIANVNGERAEAGGSAVPRASQRPHGAEHSAHKAEGRRCVLVAGGITQQNSAAQHGGDATVLRAAAVSSPSPMAAAVQRNNSDAGESVLADREGAEVASKDSEAAIRTVHREGSSDNLACSTPAEAGGMAEPGGAASGRDERESTDGAALSPLLRSPQWHKRRHTSPIDDGDSKASAADSPELFLPDALPPSRSEESTGSNISTSEAALRVAHHRSLSGADQFGETWRSPKRRAESVSGEGASGGGGSRQQLSRVKGRLQSATVPVEAEREEAIKALVREEPPASYLDKLIAEDSSHSRRAPHTPPTHAPAPPPLTMSENAGGVAAGTSEETVADSLPVAFPSSCAKSSLIDPFTHPQLAATPDSAAAVFVRYEVDPTVVRVSGPVLQGVLQHLQEVIFQRCCAHLCQDLDAPRPRFHVAHHYRRAGSTPPKAATNSIGSSSVAAAASHGATPVGGDSNGDLNLRDSGLPTASASAASAATLTAPPSEYILPLYQYTFTRVEEDALERCIAEIMAVYQGLEQLPAKEAEEWMRTAPSPVSHPY